MKGLVFGAFGEASAEVHSLLAQLVEERVEGRNAQRPLPIGKATGQALSPC